MTKKRKEVCGTLIPLSCCFSANTTWLPGICYQEWASIDLFYAVSSRKLNKSFSLYLTIARVNKLGFWREKKQNFFFFFLNCTFSSSFRACWDSGWGSGGSMEVLLLSLCVRPSGVPADPAFLFPLWWDSSSLSSRSFSDIQLFSWERVSNFSFKKSFVLSYNRFWVRSSLMCQMREENYEQTKGNM